MVESFSTTSCFFAYGRVYVSYIVYLNEWEKLLRRVIIHIYV